MKFEVEIWIKEPKYYTLTVDAESEEEAKEKSLSYISDYYDYECGISQVEKIED